MGRHPAEEGPDGPHALCTAAQPCIPCPVLLLSTALLLALQGDPTPARGDDALELHGRLFLDLPALDGEQGPPRSLRLQSRLHLDERSSLRLQLEHGRGELEVFEAYLGHRVPDGGEARLGHHRPPAGSESRTSLSVLPCPERSAPARALIPGRATGASWSTRTPDGWSLGAFGGARRSFDPIGSERLVVGRRDWDLGLARDGQGAHLGAWLMGWDGGEDGLRFDARPWGESRERTVDTGALAHARSVGAGLEWSALQPTWILQAEAVSQRVEGAGLALGSTVTLVLPRGGLLRSWSVGRQALHYPDAVEPFASHEWVLRASWLDLRELGGQRQAELSAGVNLYSSRRSRSMLHLQHTEVEGGEDLDVLLLRVQAGF